MRREFEGTWDRDELRKAIALGQPISPIAVKLTLAILAGVVIVGMNVLQGDNGIPLPAILLFVAAFVTIVWFAVERGYGRVVAAPMLQGEVTGWYTDDSLSVGTAVSNVEIPWSQFVEMKTDAKAVSLKQPSKTSMPILRNWFQSDEAWQHLIATAERGMRATTTTEPATSAVSQATPPGSIPFQGSLDDVNLRTAFMQINPLRKKAQFGFGFAVAAPLLFASMTLSDNEPLHIPFLLLVFLGPALGSSFLYWGLPWLFERSIRKNHTGELLAGRASHEGIQLKATASDAGSAIRWESFTEATIGDDVAALTYVQAVGPMMIVHRSWFSDDGDWTRFLNLVQQHVKVNR